MELDANFAIAYAYLGIAYANLGETTLAIETLKRSYDLRERASGREKFFISTFFYSVATEELDKANQELQLWIEEYPRDQNYPHLILGNHCRPNWTGNRSGKVENKGIDLSCRAS